MHPRSAAQKPVNEVPRDHRHPRDQVHLDDGDVGGDHLQPVFIVLPEDSHRLKRRRKGQQPQQGPWRGRAEKHRARENPEGAEQADLRTVRN